MNRTYFVVDAEGNTIGKVHVQGPVTGKDVYGDPSLKYIGYYDLKSLYPNNLFIEDIIDGRNLGSYFFTFIGSDGIKYNMYDLADSYNIYIQQEGASRKTLQEALKNVKEAGVTLKGCSHITGGGFYENIPRMLPEGVRAVVKKDSYPVLPIFKMLQEEGNITEEMMYNTFNMGLGMVLAVDPADVDKTMEAIKAAGDTPYVVGSVEAGEKGVALC